MVVSGKFTIKILGRQSYILNLDMPRIGRMLD